MWAGIKHALNSTLGTSSFKPLNNIITDKTSEIIGVIKGQKSLLYSDNLYYSFGTLSFSKDDGEQQLLKFNCGGSIKIKVVRVAGSRCIIKVNGIEVLQLHTSNNNLAGDEVAVNISENDVLSCVFAHQNSDSTKASFKIEIYANIIDNSAITIL